MENKAKLAKAVLAVMKAVRNIEKDMSVGTGSNAYPGLSDKLVKDKIGDAMLENGLLLGRRENMLQLPVKLLQDRLKRVECHGALHT